MKKIFNTRLTFGFACILSLACFIYVNVDAVSVRATVADSDKPISQTEQVREDDSQNDDSRLMLPDTRAIEKLVRLVNQLTPLR
jgi:hypothetical protein